MLAQILLGLLLEVIEVRPVGLSKDQRCETGARGPNTFGPRRNRHGRRRCLKFEAYIRDKPSLGASTIEGWQCVFTALDALPAKEVGRDQRSAQRWLDSLVGTGTPSRGHRTVRYTWLAAARAVFKWGVRHGKIEVNPFESCVVEVPRKTETRETGKAFNDAEVSTILSAALRVEVPVTVRPGFPWLGLLAYVDAVKTCPGPKGPLFYCHQRSGLRASIPQSGRVSGLPNGYGEGSPIVVFNQTTHGGRRSVHVRPMRGSRRGYMTEFVGMPPELWPSYEHPTIEDLAKALKQFPHYKIAHASA
jgi:hypothetical protein